MPCLATQSRCLRWPTLHAINPALLLALLLLLLLQEAAFEESQKYKVGRFILERAHVVEASTALRHSSAVLDSGYDDEHSSDMDDHYF